MAKTILLYILNVHVGKILLYVTLSEGPVLEDFICHAILNWSQVGKISLTTFWRFRPREHYPSCHFEHSIWEHIICRAILNVHIDKTSVTSFWRFRSGRHYLSRQSEGTLYCLYLLKDWLVIFVVQTQGSAEEISLTMYQ